MKGDPQSVLDRVELSGLNEPQRDAVLHEQGPLLVLAGAGSGKTRVITCRIAHLIRHRGVRPHRILAVTFTNKAAAEMRERVESMLDGEASPMVTTFHAFGVWLARCEHKALGLPRGFVVYDDDDSKRLIKGILSDMSLPRDLCDPLLNFIDECKNDGIDPEEGDLSRFPGIDAAHVLTLYQKRLRKANALDFGDLLLAPLTLFRTRPDILRSYRARFTHVLVDEYQDTNTAQFELVRMLCAPDGNLCAVGDDDQSIYRWRGARVENILSMDRDFPGLVTVRLEQNYRSTTRILDAANAVIANNKDRLGKQLWTDRRGGDPVVICQTPDERQEALFVVRSAAFLHEAERKPWRDIAVLYRLNALSRAVEEEFVCHGIPYVVVGGMRFYDRAEIKDALSYLRVAYNEADDVALARIVNVPARGIGTTTLKAAQSFAAEKGCSLLEAFRQMAVGSELGTGPKKKVESFVALVNSLHSLASRLPLDRLLKEVLVSTGYVEKLKADERDEREENLMELMAVLARFEEMPHLDGGEDIGNLGLFLEHAALMAASDVSSGQRDCVQLMSLHAAKGLEFPVVFLLATEEGIFPHQRALDNERQMPEERRLCYVGITRAKERLFITNTERRYLFGESRWTWPSRFIDEIPHECRVEMFFKEQERGEGI